MIVERSLALVALAGACLVVPAPGLVGRRWRGALAAHWRRNRGDREAEVLSWVLAMAGELRAGSDPDRALLKCADQHAVAPHAVRAARLGADVAPALLLDASSGRSLLVAVAGVWDLAVTSGTGFAETLERMATSHRRSLDVRRTLSVELAAPRATARMMSLLPLLGVLLGTVLGVDPVGWLTGTPLGLAVLFVGVALNVAGFLWIRGIVAAVERSL